MAENTAYSIITKTNDEDSQLDMFIRLSLGAVNTSDYIELKIGCKPRYVVIENFVDRTKLEWYANVTADVAATAIALGTLYTIKTVGTTDWVALGAPSNTAGVQFTATAAGTGSSGTGYAITNDNVAILTIATGVRTLLTTSSILVRDRVIQISQSAGATVLAANKDIAVRAAA